MQKMQDVENTKGKSLEHIKEMVKRNGLKGKQSFFSAVKDTEPFHYRRVKRLPVKGRNTWEFDRSP